MNKEETQWIEDYFQIDIMERLIEALGINREKEQRIRGVIPCPRCNGDMVYSFSVGNLHRAFFCKKCEIGFME